MYSAGNVVLIHWAWSTGACLHPFGYLHARGFNPEWLTVMRYVIWESNSLTITERPNCLESIPLAARLSLSKDPFLSVPTLRRGWLFLNHRYIRYKYHKIGYLSIEIIPLKIKWLYPWARISRYITISNQQCFLFMHEKIVRELRLGEWWMCIGKKPTGFEIMLLQENQRSTYGFIRLWTVILIDMNKLLGSRRNKCWAHKIC